MKKFKHSQKHHRWMRAFSALVVGAGLVGATVAFGDSGEAPVTMAQTAGNGDGTVTRNRCNVRSRPSTTAEVVTQLNKGDVVKVLERQSAAEGGTSREWLRITLPANAKCCVSAKLVSDGVVNADAVRVHCGPGANFREIGKLAKGDKLDVVKTEGDWLHIRPTPSCSGWIAAEFVEVKMAELVTPVAVPPTPITPEPTPVAITPPPTATPPAPQIRVTDRDPDMVETYVIKDGYLLEVEDAANAPGSFELMTEEVGRRQWRIAYLETTETNLKRFEGKHVRVLGNMRWKKGERFPVIVVDRVDMIW